MSVETRDLVPKEVPFSSEVLPTVAFLEGIIDCDGSTNWEWSGVAENESEIRITHLNESTTFDLTFKDGQKESWALEEDCEANRIKFYIKEITAISRLGSKKKISRDYFIDNGPVLNFFIKRNFPLSQPILVDNIYSWSKQGEVEMDQNFIKEIEQLIKLRKLVVSAVNNSTRVSLTD
ncbi:MAG: hypothetical protein Q8P53_04395 [Candidatus Shapirobacteria bacterium]|nr:hypothetical protein [Candidatus Shapirobacteria bacterium]